MSAGIFAWPVSEKSSEVRTMATTPRPVMGASGLVVTRLSSVRMNMCHLQKKEAHPFGSASDLDNRMSGLLCSSRLVPRPDRVLVV